MNKQSLTLIWAALFFAFVTCAWASGSQKSGLIGKVQSVSGRPFGIDLQGRTIYLGEFDENSANFQTYDVSDPSNPRLLGSAVTSEQVDDLAVRGSYAYVANDAQGISVFNIDHPRLPTFKAGRVDGSYANSVSLARLPPWCRRCALVGYFYTGALQIYDVSDVGSIKDPITYRSPISEGFNPHVLDSEVVGTRAYVLVDASGWNRWDRKIIRIEILDLSKLPSAPKILGYRELPLAQYGCCGRLRVLNNYLYFGAAKWPDGGPGGLRVINVSDPTRPTLVGSLDIADIGYIPWRGVGLDVVERGWNTYAFMVGKTALHVIDVSCPEKPKLVVSYPLPTEFGRLAGGNLIVRDGLAYVAASRGDGTDGHGGLAIYRIAPY